MAKDLAALRRAGRSGPRRGVAAVRHVPTPAEGSRRPAARRSSPLYSSSPPRRSSRQPGVERRGGRLWQVVVGGAAVLALLALCGLGAAALLDDRNRPPQATPTSRPDAAESADVAAQPLDSRDTDQAPLTAKELFPGSELARRTASPATRCRDQSSAGCAVAATGEVADLLVRLGCNQVVRATLRTPDGGHLVTAGLFNLTDRASAERARDRIRLLLDERQGRFRGIAAGEGSGADSPAPRRGWAGRCAATTSRTRWSPEATAGRSRSGDTKAGEILFDMIELHLSRGVYWSKRADGGTAGQPTAAPTEQQREPRVAAPTTANCRATDPGTHDRRSALDRDPQPAGEVGAAGVVGPGRPGSRPRRGSTRAPGPLSPHWSEPHW